jgi:hypothetical protein
MMLTAVQGQRPRQTNSAACQTPSLVSLTTQRQPESFAEPVLQSYHALMLQLVSLDSYTISSASL